MTDVKIPFRPWASTDSNVINIAQVHRNAMPKRLPVLPPPPPPPVAAPAPLDLSSGSSNNQAEMCRSKKPKAKPKENVTHLDGRVNKRMSREKRILANTRERVRVHEITAAFESLRQTIPSYSNSQKLSKLSILRIACSYINVSNLKFLMRNDRLIYNFPR